MLPYFTETFGNAGSTTHSFGHAAKEAVDAARQQIAAAIGARPTEIIFTSGATESNNLAIKGVAERHARRGKHIVSVVTEHPAVLDPLKRLAQRGFEVTLLPVTQSPDERAGLIRVEQVAEALRDDTILVSVMLANNEIGAIQPVAEIGRLCRERGVLLHTDATQAVGKIPVDVEQLQVDLMSFTAHKIYGPKGIGALYVRRGPQVRLEPLLDGGGQERGLRSGTLNTPGIVGFARALELCLADLPAESARLRDLRDRLYAGLTAAISRRVAQRPGAVAARVAAAGQSQRELRLRRRRGAVDEHARRRPELRQCLHVGQSRAQPRAPQPGTQRRRGPQQRPLWAGAVQYGRGGRVHHCQSGGNHREPAENEQRGGGTEVGSRNESAGKHGRFPCR